MVNRRKYRLDVGTSVQLNEGYGAGNIALIMIQQPEATLFGTRDRWRSLGRFVLEDEQDRGAKIFTKSPSGRGYVLSDAYDISQTQGREVKPSLLLQDDTMEMETALTVLLRFSPVPVVTYTATFGSVEAPEGAPDSDSTPDAPKASFHTWRVPARVRSRES